jgi:nucleotide-binding universal stress UspA family protein
MYQKILVPLDQSRFAEPALPPALSLAERSGGEIHLVSVISPLPPFALGEQAEGTRAGWVEERRAGTARYLEAVRARIEEAGTSVAVETLVLSGHPVRALHEWILTAGIDQVVMTTHGRGGVKRLWLGSVADGLVRRVPCPVLLWRSGDGEVDLSARPTLDRILVPLDGSELAAAILPWAEALVRLFGGSVFLASIVPEPLPLGSPYLPHLAAEGTERGARVERMAEYLAEAARRLRRRNIMVETEVLSGPSTADGIISYAERIRADVVVLSTHGRGGGTRLVLGSVADKVIRGSERHVLVHLDAEEL